VAVGRAICAVAICRRQIGLLWNLRKQKLNDCAGLDLILTGDNQGSDATERRETPSTDPGGTFKLGEMKHNKSVRFLRRCILQFVLFTGAALVLGQDGASEKSSKPEMPEGKRTFGLVIHGGAGTIDRAKMRPEREKEYRDALERSLRAGFEILERGGSSLDTTEAAVRVLEDDPHFNAGKGAVFTSAGVNELDAAIMDGRTLKAGAVASVKRIKNPVSLARLVMEKSPHVMLDCVGAEAFANEQGIELVDPKYFFTQARWDELKRTQEAAKPGGGGKHFSISDQNRHGTVGAVALDQAGNLAAATSTGGTTNKRPGRIGDTPVIGAGTYANNATCAVSGTGDGEYFIRAAVGHDVSALMEYRSMPLQTATETVLKKVENLGGTGGLIAIDRTGEMASSFNTSGMYRGRVGPDGKFIIEIYR
jgi:beta-aspartyl-peptidase (threonine type)